LLIHVADISDPLLDEKIESVEKILLETGYASIPRITILNKADRVNKEIAYNISKRYNAAVISAKDKNTTGAFFELLESKLAELNGAENVINKKIA